MAKTYQWAQEDEENPTDGRFIVESEPTYIKDGSGKYVEKDKNEGKYTLKDKRAELASAEQSVVDAQEKVAELKTKIAEIETALGIA